MNEIEFGKMDLSAIEMPRGGFFTSLVPSEGKRTIIGVGYLFSGRTYNKMLHLSSPNDQWTQAGQFPLPVAVPMFFHLFFKKIEHLIKHRHTQRYNKSRTKLDFFSILPTIPRTSNFR